MNCPLGLQHEETLGSLFSGNCDRCSFQLLGKYALSTVLIWVQKRGNEGWTKLHKGETNNLNFSINTIRVMNQEGKDERGM
jgi:hypothetical protein